MSTARLAFEFRRSDLERRWLRRRLRRLQILTELRQLLTTVFVVHHGEGNPFGIGAGRATHRCNAQYPIPNAR